MHPGVAVATVSTIGFMGFLLGPPLIGFIAEILNLQWAFALVALLGLTTSIMASKVKTVQ
jgi:MFS family permease